MKQRYRQWLGLHIKAGDIDTQKLRDLPEEELRSLRGMVNLALRKTPPTRAGGRPPEPRCPCGKFTLRTAEKKGHKCK